MMVSNHFDVRWVDGYSAVSDVPSSLALVIEKLAAELPSSHDRIELAVRDVRRSDGSTTWVGLLRFVVVVSSVPRPLGYLHAAVLPAGYRVDPDGWRAIVARRYGEHPEERIRELYEELAESTKEVGRDRLHALSIRIDDVLEHLVAFDEPEPPPNLPRTYTRPGSRPPKSHTKSSTPVPAGPPKRPSNSALPPSVRVVDLPEPPPEAARTEEMPSQSDLPNDVTQPMEVPPPGTAAPLSGQHPQHRPADVARAPRAWWVVGSAAGALVVLLGAVGWLVHSHIVLVGERDRLEGELSKRLMDPRSAQCDRGELERVKIELDQCRATDRPCEAQVDAATKECKESLTDARSLARINGDRVEQLREEARLKANEVVDVNGKLAKLKNDLSAVTASKDRAEQLYREEQATTKQLQTSLSQQDELLRGLCRRLQLAPNGGKPPKECQGYK